jgi:hypothetical protein
LDERGRKQQEDGDDNTVTTLFISALHHLVVKTKSGNLHEIIAHMGKQINAYKVLLWKTESKRLLGTRSVDEIKILNWILDKQDGSMWFKTRKNDGPL